MKKLNELQSYLTRLRGLMLTLIILCSIGVGNVRGADTNVTIKFGTTNGYWAAHNTASYTDSDSRSWSRTYAANKQSSGGENYSQFGNNNKGNVCKSLILTATAGKAMTITAFSVTMAGGDNKTAGTIYLYKMTSGGTETKLATQSLSGSSNVTCSISSNATFTSTDILKVSYVGTAKSIQIKTLSYSYSTGGGSKYTVSFNTGTGNPSQADITEASGGAGITLPNVTPNCSDDGWALYGWATSACGSETSTAPTIVGKPGDTYKPESNITLYAVYAKGEYTKITSTSSIDDGGKYLIVASYSSNNYIMTNKVTTDKYGDWLNGVILAETSTNKYHAASVNAAWVCTFTESSSKYYYIQNASGGYIDTYYSSSDWYNHTPIDPYDKYTITYSSGAFYIVNYYGSKNNLVFYNAGTFGPSERSCGLLLYEAGTISYYSSPTCCTPLGTINGPVSLSQLATPDPTKLKASWAMNSTTGLADKGLIVKVYRKSDDALVHTSSALAKNTTDYTITGLSPCTSYYATLTTVRANSTYCEGVEDGISDPFSTTGYTYTVNKTNVSLKAGETEATNSCENFIAEYVADTGYDLPATITVTGASSYDWENGVLMINEVNVTGNVTVEITGAQSNYTVSWSVNGADWTGAEHGSPSTNAEGGTKPAVIPTAPVSADCDGIKVFVGWTNAAINSPTDERPAILFTSQSEAPEITENTTFYAVFATASSGGGGGSSDYVLVESDLSTDWAGDYLIAYSSTVFADGRVGGTEGIGAQSNQVNPSTNLSGKEVAASWGDTYHVTLEEISSGSNTYVLKTQDNKYNYHTNNTSNGLSSTTNKETAAAYPITVNFKSSSDIRLALGGAATGSVFRWNNAVIASGGQVFRFYKDCGQSAVYLYKKTGGVTYSNYATTCCQQPVTQLAIDADQTELVRSGAVNFTLTGGNGKDITWSCRDESDANCDDLLTSTSNSGATLTISSPVAATKTYTVKAVQPENDDDAEVVCGKTVTMDITVKAQWTITFQTTDAEGATEYSHTTVTDGDTYTFPDLSDDYICETNYSFAGWKAVNSDGAPEYAAGSSATASADKIWYAVWMYSTGTKTITRDKYELVTSSSAAIAEDDVVVIACNSQGVALAQMTASDTYGSPVAVDFATDKSYLTFASGTNVMELKVLNYADEGADSYYFVDNANTGNAITIANSSPTGKLHYSTNTKFWTWKITITVQNNATIEDYVNREYAIEYNSSNNRFAYYKKTQKKVQLYRKNGKVSVEVPADPTYYVNNEHCTNGATIRANGGQWITSAKDQKVRITVPVTAKNFATSGKQLTASSDNSHFSVSFPSHTIPSDKREVEVQMTVEYTPTEANTIEEANITITTGTGDGNATKVISVNGRSLPDEFVIVTQKEGKWQALPANMFSGTGTYSPMEVTPNGGITAIPAAPYTTIYSAREVASGRYESAGTCMRLVGNNNKCLWANNSSNGTGIQNFAALGNTNGAQYEWLLSTADGEQYTIANPAHPDYATGRQLGIYTLKYGLYKTTDIFYLLPVGCSSQPGNLQITPRRVDAMFSWETNAASVTIDLWTNEAMSTGPKQAVVTSVPYQFTGLTENTDYWYKITPGSDDHCAVTGTFSTTGPTIDVVEWGENSATIFVDKDEAVDPQIIIAGEVEHGQGGGAAATDIFFSKYFEAEGTAKMLAIYNGTGNAISLADITILHRSTTKNYTPLSLASYGKTAGWIQPGEEIILFNRDNRAAVMSCAESDPTYPSWNNVENTNLAFSGKGTIRLFRGNECIDIIGAMAAGKDINDKAVNPIEGSARPSFGDANGFVSTSGDNYATKETVENDYELSTNRCLLIRQNWVTSGDSAVLNNYGDFKTLGTYTGVDSKTHKGEWAGLQVPDAVAPEADYIHTCAGFQEVGKFDYNQYYREYTQIGQDKYLSDFTRAADGTYTLPIAYMRQYACLNLKFQLTEHNNKTNVLTEQTVQVPIVVKDARNSNDTLFNNIIKTDKAPHTPMVPQSIERCKTCNVVVRPGGTLTKAQDGTEHDVAELFNLKIYPGGKLVIPEGNYNYKLNTLAMRRDGEDIPLADIQGGLTIGQSNGVYLDLRIDHSDWHYVALPYDCRLSDVTFSDGTVAVLNTDYFVAAYDGEYRAANKKTKWTDIMDDDYVLKKGIGHIIALSGSGSDKRELRFPMANDVISEEKASSKTVSGVYGYGADKKDEELRPNHKGWNMVGNPYFKYFSPAEFTTPLATGELVYSPVVPWDGTWIIKEGTSHLRYVVRPIDNGWSGYEQVLIGGTKMEPFTAYFVQIGITGEQTPETEQSVIFDKSKLSMSAPAHRRVKAEETENMYPIWYGIEMIAPNAEKDQTALLISDEFTDGYDMMNDLAKQRGDYYTYYNKPVLASRNNEGEMAFNALPDSSAATVGVPLNYYAAQAGTYTIATDNRFNLEEVKSAMLHDATNNTYTDLLTQNYEFTASKGNNTDRFTLYVRVERKKAPEVATGTDNILENGKLSLIAIDRTLVLSGLDEAADIYVYDMSGKLIKGERNAGESVWRANVSAQGVYFVRVNSQSGQQTLRTIVK